mmetsp:Transcript_3167/g.10497  ORF Transcript_3167/g.10497 Transcript_3167/m.10497 type:complete len:207 (+) Transcript_3167:416-1036(+)
MKVHMDVACIGARSRTPFDGRHPLEALHERVGRCRCFSLVRLHRTSLGYPSATHLAQLHLGYPSATPRLHLGYPPAHLAGLCRSTTTHRATCSDRRRRAGRRVGGGSSCLPRPARGRRGRGLHACRGAPATHAVCRLLVLDHGTDLRNTVTSMLLLELTRAYDGTGPLVAEFAQQADRGGWPASARDQTMLWKCYMIIENSSFKLF